MSSPVVVLAGGTGGAKLARGMLDVVGADELVVIANTGDDVEIYNAYVSPDPDLITFWLADRIDERGWGLADDTFNTMDGMRELGVDVWFNLGDRDLAIGLERARALAAGDRLTDAQATDRDPARRPRPGAPDERPARSHPRARARALVVAPGVPDPGPRRGSRSTTSSSAEPQPLPPPPSVLEAIATARAIVIGPSNPVISIGPILAVPGASRRARDTARRRSSRSARWCAGPWSRARPSRSWRGPAIR